MSTMLVALSQHLDTVNQRCARVREVLRTRQRANDKSADDKPATAAAQPLIAAPLPRRRRTRCTTTMRRRQTS